MAFDRSDATRLRERIEASNHRTATQPLRPAVDVTPGIRLAHVKDIHPGSLDTYYVPVQLIRRTRPDPATDPWDGTWEYWGEIENAVCLPPLTARQYKAFEYRGDEWQADIPVVKLFWYDGAWIVDHPQLAMVTSAQLGELLQDFVIEDGTPVPELPE